MQYSISVPSSNTPVSQKLQYMTILHIYFSIVAVYLQYILQTSWSVHSVYTATILPYTVSLLHFGQGNDDICLHDVSLLLLTMRAPPTQHRYLNLTGDPTWLAGYDI